MTGLSIWVRRSLAARLAPLVLAFFLGVLALDRAWTYEWGLGMRHVLLPLTLVSCLLSGLVADDVSRRWQPTVGALGGNLTRWRWTLVAPAAAATLVCVAVLGITWSVVVLTLTLRGAAGSTDVWTFVEPVAGLCAAGSTGLLFGRRMSAFWAGPAAAGFVYAVVLLGGAYGFPTVYVGMAAVSSLLGLERVPVAAVDSIGVNLCISVMAAALALSPVPSDGWARAGERWRRAALAVPGVLLILRMGVGAPDAEFRPTTGEACAGNAVQVCGPSDGADHVKAVAALLGRGSADLGDSGLPLQSRYSLARPGDVRPSSLGIVEITPQALATGDRTDLITTSLSRPVLCAQFIEDGGNPEAYLEDQELVQGWMTQQLLTGGRDRAPDDVASAFGRLLNCASDA